MGITKTIIIFKPDSIVGKKKMNGNMGKVELHSF